MTYTGEVRVGGPSDAREIDGLTVTKIAVGPMNNNAYLLRCAGTGQGLLIDAANEPGRLIEMIGDTPVGTIVTTHRHFDHWQALPEVQTRTGAVVVAHQADADELPVEVGLRARRLGDVEYTSRVEGCIQNVTGVLWCKVAAFDLFPAPSLPTLPVNPATLALPPTPRSLVRILPCSANELLQLAPNHLTLMTAVEPTAGECE